MRRLVIPLSVAALFLVSLSGAADACRCAQLPIERYWESAEIVLVGRVTAVEPRMVDGVQGQCGGKCPPCVPPPFDPEDGC